MKKTVRYYNLDELVTDKSQLSDLPRNDKWVVVPYKTKNYSGRMLCCGECSYPEPIELKIELTGWYKVYVGVINASYSCKVGITIGDLGKSIVKAPGSGAWGAVEYGYKMFYRAADMTGQTVTVTKPGPYSGSSAAISFLEFVEMEEDEIKEYTTKSGGVMFYHFDEGFLGECSYEKDRDYLGFLNLLEGSHGGIFAMETISASKPVGKEPVGDDFTDFINGANSLMKMYEAKKNVIKPMIVDRAHELGFEVYTSNRIQVGDFTLPLYGNMVRTFPLSGNEDKKIETRDGKCVPALSYAYESVRRMAIESIIYATDDLDYDGVSLSFHRGVFLGFEKPVRDRVEALYGIDARVIPASDERLHGVWCEYITQFLRELRASLDERYGKEKKKINAIVFADPRSSKNFGYDVEAWMKEGLVSNISQGLMEWWEELDGCLDEKGLVDIEKYERAVEERAVLRREYKYKDPTRLLDGAKAFMNICKPYGVDFYATLGWDGGDMDVTLALAKEFRDAGIEKIFSWNTNRKVVTPALMNTERYIAANFTEEFVKEPEKLERFRVIEYGDSNISYFDINWNG